MRDKLFTRNFTFLILGQISSLLGNYTVKFALSMYVLEQTGSAAVFAGLLAAAMLPTILLSPFGGILADRANRRNIMVALDALSGLSVLTAGLAISLGNDILVIGVLLVMFCACQVGCSIFSTYAVSVIQERTPERLMGKVMSCVFTLSMCAQPLGQIIYGALFDIFSDRAYWVLIPSGVLVGVIGAASRGFFIKFEGECLFTPSR